MKKHLALPASLISVSLFFCIPIFSQDPASQRVDMVDMKMDLLETKLELLNSRISLLEEKPASMEIQLKEIETDINRFSYSMENFGMKYRILDSLITEQQAILDEQEKSKARIAKMDKLYQPGTEREITDGTFMIPSNKYVISMLPLKLFEGTMDLSVERVLNKGNSVELAAMATYASKQGIARYYLSNQKLEYYNADVASYIPYSSENITGYGGSITWRNYLLARTKPSYSAPGGPYVAPSIMGRRLTLSGFDWVYDAETDTTVMMEVVQHLNVFSGGFLAGCQFVLWDVVTADIFVGGVVRLSKYEGEEEFTKYKQLQNIDFSGVMPTFGVRIGIVK